ncbi:SCO5918 family protein [Streptomyces bohaiensis]|uniref:Heavy-metal-associated domain-containing protein n=1 Tax=Streptomyces bohaiensis TaxID=1431344 RepID=A0ABX1C4Y6_9ACTN|nr:SCO5918 family protein [Streptomyces bohaiensis]NJQ14279.1 hypothetical protein [Streptomyces bohaiensis]
MRCVIARFPFELTENSVLASMKGVEPEEVTGAFVTIDGRNYPAKQVGQILTGQDRRDFSAGEVTRAMTRLGFTCTAAPAAPAAAAAPRSPLEEATALFGPPSAP